MFKSIKDWLLRFREGDLLVAGVAILVLLFTLGFISKCAYSDTPIISKIKVDTAFGIEFDDPKVYGRNPVGIVNLRLYALDTPMYIGYTHHSSAADQDDRNVFDGLSIGATFTFGPRGCR